MRLFVFICTPLTPRSPTANHAIEYLGYVREAVRIGAELIKRGFAVYCPANDFPFWLCSEQVPSADDIYEVDLAILHRCDAVLAIGNFRQSPNCLRELAYADACDIPIFYGLDALEGWRNERSHFNK